MSYVLSQVLLGSVHTETFSCVFVLFQVMSWLFSIPLRTVNNTKTQENVSGNYRTDMIYHRITSYSADSNCQSDCQGFIYNRNAGIVTLFVPNFLFCKHFSYVVAIKLFQNIIFCPANLKWITAKVAQFRCIFGFPSERKINSSNRQSCGGYKEKRNISLIWNV